LALKQDILTPGDNITIQNGVISAIGGGGSGGGTSSNQLSRMSYYSGYSSLIKNGVINYYCNMWLR
jgi:hypothetical protein